MSLKQRILDDMKEAMRARDTDRLATLRMLKAKITEAEVAKRSAHGVDYQLDDQGVLAVLAAYAKQRREAIEAYSKGGRDDLVEKERRELEVVEAYLPRQLGEEEIRERLKAIVAQVGASGPGDLGKVMKAAMAELRGAADGKLVNRLAREILSGS
ncbi:MAG: GatB/YqeY domain-containing protein [Acidobacteria bacterium]|nr:MAG: GatB/YqeY domain-containing protein [Acidobacteriota bacterium]